MMMGRVMMLTAVAALALGGGGAWAQKAPKANCALYKRTADGRWFSTIDSKVGNPKQFKLLKAGIAIDPDMTIVGLNVVNTISKLCSGK